MFLYPVTPQLLYLDYSRIIKYDLRVNIKNISSIKNIEAMSSILLTEKCQEKINDEIIFKYFVSLVSNC